MINRRAMHLTDSQLLLKFMLVCLIKPKILSSRIHVIIIILLWGQVGLNGGLIFLVK
jgi:hypothetical protein